MPAPLIKAFGVLKKAAAQVNATYGELQVDNSVPLSAMTDSDFPLGFSQAWIRRSPMPSPKPRTRSSLVNSSTTSPWSSSRPDLELRPT
jgi:hypothetical protein